MIQSMLDNDQYKFTMQQAALLLGYANVPVEYKFKCRTEGVDLTPARQHIEEGLDGLFNLRMKSEDLDYLETLRYIKAEYLSFMKHFQFDPEYIKISWNEKLPEIRIKGPFFYTTLFEVPILAIISESWSRVNPGDERVAQNL